MDKSAQQLERAEHHFQITQVRIINEAKKKGREGGKIREAEGVFVIIPIPRDATSVATMMGLLPVLN